MMDVVMHPRCINCHPNDNVPKQGDDSHPHYFGISRGPENTGFEATSCTTCHQSENNEYSGVPGARILGTSFHGVARLQGRLSQSECWITRN